MSYDDLIRAALQAHWHLAATEIVPLPAGLMSRAWAVRTGEEDLVVRLVDDAARQPLEAGLGAAVHLHARGIAVGQPVRTLGGALTAETVAGTLAVLRRVPGRSLHPDDPVDQQWWGDRLGAAHRELTGFGRQGPHRWSRLQPEAPHLSVENWLRPAVADAMTAMTRLTVTDRLTYGVLHGDPAAEGFVVDAASGRAGLLDWGACGTGPLLYDVAAAVVYAGGPDTAAELLDGYLAAGPVGRDEADAALPVLLRFRWAVQADWYARRLAAVCGAAEGDGAGDPAPLRVPLQAARAALEEMAG